jgi:hypothetical protein
MQQPCLRKALHLAVDNTEGRVKPPGKVCQAVFFLSIKQQYGENVSLQSRPEDRQQCWSSASHFEPPCHTPAIRAKCQPGAVWAISITTGTLVNIGCELRIRE